MTLNKKWTLGLLSLAAAVVVGVSATTVYAQTVEETPEPEAAAGWMWPAKGEDHNALLAEALGISVEELQAAQTEARNAAIDQAVAEGQLTQEEADLMKARLALQEYLQERLQTAYEEGVEQAVADGIITQEQAEQILSEGGLNSFGRGFFGPGFHGGGHRGGPGGYWGGHGGRHPGGFPNGTTPQPDNGTPQGSDSPLTPPTASSL